ncbi:PEGA domain-containing protein [Sorangium sp. So ce291]|uniref:PEGA domain-containing protein n=1 Tax=Sorangium sp. So ce291 TaxID=3133294 RepID=UPI003F5FF8B2
MSISRLAPPRVGILALAAGLSLAGCAVRSADVAANPTLAPSCCCCADMRRGPTQEPSSVQLTPEEMAATQEQAEAALKEALTKVMTLKVTTVPEGAQVTVDGRVVGRTPFAYPVFLAPGVHWIDTELEGHIPSRDAIEATAGKTVNLTVNLSPSKAEVAATTDAPLKEASPVATHVAEESER